MPEINEPTKTSPLFQIPKRRRFAKTFTVLGVIVILLGAAWTTYALLNSSNQQSGPLPLSESETEHKPVEPGANYYLVREFGEVGKSPKTWLYQFFADADTADKQILETSAKNLYVLADYLNPYTYITATTSDSNLKVLDVSTGKLEPLFDLPSDVFVRDVAISKDKQWLAYGRNYEGSENGKGSGEIWLYNLQTKEQKQLVKKTELGLYQGFSVLGWRDNDKELIVNDLGGDAGQTWGDIYQVNAETGQYKKVTPVAEKNKMEFLRGELSPSGDKWLFEFCTQPDASANDDVPNYNPCASGTELRTYDFGTQQTKTVYHNLRYDNNVDKNILRTFMSYIWQDDENIVAAAPGALLAIPANGNAKAEELHAYDRYNPQNFKNHYRQLQSAGSDYIVFSDDAGWHVLNRSTKKLLSIDLSSNRQDIIGWLD